MRYLICDDKLAKPEYAKKVKALKCIGIEIYEYLDNIIKDIGEKIFVQEDESWTLLIHSGNADFREQIIKVLEKFQKNTPHIDLFLISTWVIDLDESMKQNILKFVDKIGFLDKFTPEIYLNVKSWEENIKKNKFRRDFFPEETPGYFPALLIFCQGYLMSGIAVGNIEDKEVETLIGWNDKIKEIFKKSKHDWEVSWKKAKNPHWWFSKEQIKYLKEHQCSNMEKLIDYIEKGSDIEDYRVIKEAFIELGKS